MASPSNANNQNLLPVQAYFDLQGNFQTFIGQNKPFFATISPYQSGLVITNSTIDSTTIGATTPSTGVFTNISTTTGQISTGPVNAADIANKLYVDTVAQGLGPKQACQCGTTANITLSGLQTIDGDTTLAGDRVLVKNQTNAANNGIYIAASSAWSRSADMNTWAEVSGAYTVVLNGGQAETGWVCTSPTHRRSRARPAAAGVPTRRRRAACRSAARARPAVGPTTPGRSCSRPPRAHARAPGRHCGLIGSPSRQLSASGTRRWTWRYRPAERVLAAATS